ncbi:MAG: bifunctional glutamate N-acetyltransferase/amino-acid acetyltransferase ArgJ [Kiritimatiellia bacterium]|jgi:glutamate N-acetyltransferase/amino-acid N-acetyltransferase|nr:bifunctional glutamate N-acetyltransferase/amino-acid acetyltransferase ArgJ [Kiritimatiellia bacterium]
MKRFEFVEGGVTAARGFRACGVEAGIKVAGRKDLAMLAADAPATVAAVYTTNKVAAAPVRIDRERTLSGQAQAVVVNSGCANACTGETGLADAREMARLAGVALGIDERLVLVCSTGVIGVHLPMERIAAGVKAAAGALTPDGGDDAAHAILTTDTVDKQVAVELEIDGKTVVIGGMCKGSGMIEPNMATMLGFVTTDAAVHPKALDQALREAVEVSFNRVVVDGDRSTNDTVILMAGGAAGNETLTPYHPQWQYFVDALTTVCLELGKKMVLDGEGATKFVTVRVRGARTDDDAAKAARAVSKSALVKTSWFGLDPNWGRVIAAVGYSGAEVDDQRAQIYYGDICAYDQGRVADKELLQAMREVMRKRAFEVTVDLHLGEGEDTVYTCDFSYDYVKINAEYTT